MKTSDSHLQLAWSFSLSLNVPIRRKQAGRLANRALVAACLLSLAFGLAPLLG